MAPTHAKATKSVYSVHPSLALVQTSMRNLHERTGRTIHQWVEFVKQAGPPTEKERREWLKAKHGLGTNYAWWIAERAEGKGWEDDDPEKYLATAERYVEDMYAGGKAGLKPIYDHLLKMGLSLGADVKACPCKTMVPLYRRHVFAEIKPATRTRIDLGLALGDTRAPKRLIETGGKAKGDRVTHRIAIESLKDVDDEVARWMKKAYERDA
jgi:hypothetical protein